MAIAKIKQTAFSQGKAQMTVKSRNFEIIMDEPKSVGGENLAPSPTEYLMASLAGCLNAIARGIAMENGWKVGEIMISLEGELEIEDQGIIGQERAIFREIKVLLKADTTLTRDEYEFWLKECERRCAISRTLQNPIRVEIGLAKM